MSRFLLVVVASITLTSANLTSVCLSNGPCEADSSCPTPGYVCDTVSGFCCAVVDYTKRENIVGPAVGGLCPIGFVMVIIPGGNIEGECVSLQTVPGVCDESAQQGICPGGMACTEGFTCFSLAESKMVIEFASLSRNVFGRIFTYLDKATILQMREVCTATTEVVDMFMLSVRKTVVKLLLADRNNLTRETCLQFNFEHYMDYHAWKLCFNHAMKALFLTGFFWEENYQRLTVTLWAVHIARFFAYLKPTVRLATFVELRFGCCAPNIIEMCSQFPERKVIHKLSIGSRAFKTHENMFYLHVIERCNPEWFCINIGVKTTATLEWICQVADMVKQLTISVFKYAGLECNTFSLIRNVLSRKCEKLDMIFWNCSVSIADTERLIQTLNITDKRACIQYNINSRPVNTTIGVYSVKIHEFSRSIEIKHLKQK